MSSDITLAFAHPEARAAASAPTDPRDRISLRDHVVEADIGAFQQERGHSQRLQFNVVVEVRQLPDPLEDDVDRILSYDRITEAIAAELAEERVNLLETLAARVAERVLAAPQAMRVFVRIEKLDRGPGALGVEIVRSRAAAPTKNLRADGGEEALHPVVAYLSNAAIDAPGLAARLDALLALSKDGEHITLPDLTLNNTLRTKEDGSGTRAFDQGYAQLGFCIRNLFGEAWLAHAQLQGCVTETARVRDRHDVLELAKGRSHNSEKPIGK